MNDKQSTRVTEVGTRSRVLSIQSHVVHGYVGNKAAVFPLQLLGFDVDIINSVQFSNHTGHPHGWDGDVLDGDQLASLLSGLRRNSLLDNVGHLLTGYIGSASFLRAVLDVLRMCRREDDEQECRRRQHVRYVCDPVLGDNGKFYVSSDLVPIYKNEVLPLADVVTPNQFELEQLTGLSIGNLNDVKVACAALHDLGPGLVLVTSLTFADCESLTVIASRRKRRSDGTDEDEMWRIDTPIIEGHFTGTGDVCAALLLAWTAIHPHDLSLALEKVTGTMHLIIRRTAELSQHCAAGDVLSGSNAVASRELKLIQSKEFIEHPPADMFKAKRLS
eukprot:CAMPEP_0172513388 /NCGR_PEP_ID=MMETSP1066-20121228/252118_1 /TAXON_ID=671091 /ORGANISM="Coscinodiscus wailesii, Strain CCMP2513" /LENGTH=331 /DNA_ID=CAMNT_0013293627 /DNA_START=55 /DNA_END=1050 /DNA_ORIENTATION=+